MNLDTISKDLEPLRKELTEHSLYGDLNSVEMVNVFMEQHIYAVWDFMSLIKWLQNKVTCTEVPWLPSKIDGNLQRFVNEIVLAEESDTDSEGNIKSHMGMYLDAMAQSGASSEVALNFMKGAAGKKDMVKYLRQNFLPGKVMPFLEFTFNLLQEGKAHKIASAFTFGREDLIPDMFISMVKKLDNKEGNLNKLVYYLERHIEIDGEEHGPMSRELVASLCGKNDKKWMEAKQAAKEALQARIRLWNGIHETVKMKQKNLKVFV